jgi:ligand-binding sensor domain-containing protein/signal transduction histidine kinase
VFREIRKEYLARSGKLLLAALLFCSQILHAQFNHYQLKFKSITIDEGLTNNKVNAISKDKYGFIWFATNDGVCRFDGLNIRPYYLDPLNAQNTNTNHINTLYTDINGDLWIGAFSLFKYDYQTDSLRHYSPRDSTLALGRIRSIVNDDKGTLWIGTTNGLFSYFPGKDSVVYHRYMNKEKFEILTILPDNNRLWIGTDKYGLLVFHLDDCKFSAFNLMDGMQEDQNSILCLFKDGNGMLWAGTNSNGILQFNIHDSTFARIIPDRQLDISQRVRKIISDDRGNIWIGTRAGLFVKFPGATTLYHYAHTNHKTSKISDNSIYDIYIDNNKIMWFGTYAGGVNYTDLLCKPIYNFSKDGVIGESLSDNLLYGFCEDEKGNMYIGTNEGGLNYFEKNSGKFKWFMKEQGNPCSINSNNVKSIVREKSGNLWIAAYRGGVSCFDVKSECFTALSEISKSPGGLQSNNIYSLVLDKNENLWIASDKGIDLYQRDENIIKNIFTIDKVLILYQDHQNRIWAGVEDIGLFQYDDGIKTFIQQFGQYINFCVRTIHFDENDNIWIGGDNGLSFFGTKDSTFINYTQADGLPTNLIMGILEDDHKNLWVSTTAGLLKCVGIVEHPDSLQIRVLTVQDGLQNKHFLNYSYYKSSSGDLFFGGTKGFSMFHPDSIRDNPYMPQVAFTGLKIFNSTVKVGQKIKGKVVLEKTINQCNEITLSHKHRIFTIEFTALHYASPKDNHYKYMMYPFEKDWNYSDASRPFATYSNLPGGTYTFRLIAANSDDLWTGEPKELTIRILPPIWRTIWFYMFLLLVIISMVILYYYSRIKVIKKQKDKLELMVEKRTKTITEMNDILKSQTIELQNINSLLKEQKNQITKQAEQLKGKKEELLKQKEMLQNLNSMKDRFFSIIAHDLKGPFQGILGMTELLDKNYDQFSSQERKKYFNTIHNSSKNFYDLLENLLCWSRTQLNHISCQPSEFSLAEIIHRNRLLYEDSIVKKNITITEYYVSETMAFADQNMIDTVIRNLLSNAIKFTGYNGKIDIKISGNEDMKLISFRDTGIGMSREFQQNLFKIDKSITRQGTADEMGTGLGLIICKEFIEKNGGEIWVESEAGKGATFFFTLPENHIRQKRG